jgi:hypothetical protein
MQKWEYLIHEKGLSPKVLDDYGRDGWEMVGFARTTDDFTMIFKRPFIPKPIEQKKSEVRKAQSSSSSKSHTAWS